MRHRNYKKPLFSPFSYTSDQESTYEDHFCTKHWKISLNSEHIHLRERPPSKSCVWEQCLFIKALGHLTFLTPPASTPSSPWNTTCQKKEEIVRQSHQAFPSFQLVERSESVNRRDISSFRAKMKVWIESRSLREPTQISLVFQIICYYHDVYNNASFY